MKKGMINNNLDLFNDHYKNIYDKIKIDSDFKEEYLLFYKNLNLSPLEIMDFCMVEILEIAKEIKNPKVLILGGGSGFEAYRFKMIFKDFELYSIDIAEWGEKLGKEIIDGDFVNLYTCDMCQLVFCDNFFDIIFSSHSLEHTGDIDKTMSEVYRTIKDRGLFGLGYPYKWNTDEQHVYEFEDDLPEYMSKYGEITTAKSKEHQSKLLKIRIKK